MIKQDLRVLKTKKNIYEAFLHLLEEQSFERIKISQICEKALVNRSTFYAHFEDKYSLLDSFIKDLKGELQKLLETNNDYTSIKQYYMNMISLFLQHIDDSLEIYEAIIVNNRDSVARDMIYETLRADVATRLEKDKTRNGKIPADFISDFYLGAILHVGLEWIHSKKTYSKEEILDYLDQLIPDYLF